LKQDINYNGYFHWRRQQRLEEALRQLNDTTD